MSRFCFEDFEADIRSGELRRSGRKIKLGDQSFQILAMLVNRAGDVVTRDEIRRQVWDSDTYVDFEAGINSAIRRLRLALRDSAQKARFIETLPRHGYRFMKPVEHIKESLSRPRIESLAVLPFENLTGEPDQDFFADGMTDALITRLAQIEALRVISRTSVLRFKTTDELLPEIARKLNVDGIVEGSVTRSGERVCVTAQLVYAPDDTHLWAKRFERDLTDVLLLQAEIAGEIATDVEIRLTPKERTRLARARSVNPDAYDAYLRGRLHWNKRTEQGMRKGLELFQKALEKDPSFALSYTGIAECHNLLAWWGFESPGEGSANADAAVAKALEIEPSLAEAHAAWAWVRFVYHWDWKAGERGLRRAIELNPGYAVAHQWYSHLLANQGRLDQAYAEVRRTLELDPLSTMMNSSGAIIYLQGRQFDETIRRAQETLELDPQFAPTYLWLGRAYSAKGMHEKAIGALQTAVNIGDSPVFLSGLGHAYAIAGKVAEARSILTRLMALRKKRYVSAYEFATIYAGLGDIDLVFEWLGKAVNERSTWLETVAADSRFDPYSSDRRFYRVLDRLNLSWKRKGNLDLNELYF